MVAIKKIKIKKLFHHSHVFLLLRAIVWFGMGLTLGLFFLISFTYIIFTQLYRQTVFPGIFIGGVAFGGKSEQSVERYFQQKNSTIAQSTITFQYKDSHATISARELHLGYNSQLLAKQAISIGRSTNTLSNISLVFSSYLTSISLPTSYSFSANTLTASLKPLTSIAHIAPIDAQFQFENGKVTTFKPSVDGQDIDLNLLTKLINEQIPYLIAMQRPQHIVIPVPIQTVRPKITTESVNNLGIKELIGSGTSLFQHSIASRIYNVELAASRLNGIVVAPNEEFSFDKALGDVSAYTGYKQAYVIEGGKTVLGDGGGVCQVSTTMFRAILSAGLPVTERHAHDYRVGYYEEDGPPGIDATVYVPSVDLKFKNDTGHNILIQTTVDPDQLRLTFNLYGVSDGRQATLTTPIVTNETPSPPTKYQDDPTLPKGEVKQVDFSANGATVKFNRTVTRNGQEIINETYVSNYRPWQAIYLVGTQ